MVQVKRIAGCLRYGLAATVLAAMPIPGAAQALPDAYEQARTASTRLVAAIESVDGCLGVHTARSHDGSELILAWFEDRAAVLRWYDHSYHRQLLRDAGRPEDGIAAEHFGNEVGPILVIASVAYPARRGALDASMFDDPVAGRPERFSVEYYTPLPGGAFMERPFAPNAVKERIPGIRDVFDDDG
ncbi:antibiotic biosynthesis monooxygenase [Parasphingopyxis sp.]|uniref:antibiotic biosynthesis monooxygenase family protein n=1 Tax=Parasphingopyxis sp. TaxID=1920299 RepID=UPI00261500E8|nr:antibiotic biosynthesis monooxygenase [Parasphingopyxis sp.]